jgi:hypothetical protein
VVGLAWGIEARSPVFEVCTFALEALVRAALVVVRVAVYDTILYLRK